MTTDAGTLRREHIARRTAGAPSAVPEAECP
jgi:hypothetical protein